MTGSSSNSGEYLAIAVISAPLLFREISVQVAALSSHTPRISRHRPTALDGSARTTGAVPAQPHSAAASTLAAIRTLVISPSGHPALTSTGYHPHSGWLQVYNDLEMMRVSAFRHADAHREQRSVTEAQKLFGSDEPLVLRRETMTLHGVAEQ